MKRFLALVFFLVIGGHQSIECAPQVAVQELAENRSTLTFQPSASDDLHQNLATMVSPTPWHPANTLPENQEAALTDGLDLSGFSGLLNDFLGGDPNVDPLANQNVPAAVAEWYFTQPEDLYEIRVFSGNEDDLPSRQGRDGRTFHHYDVAVTTNPNPAAGPFTLVAEEVIPVATGVGFGVVGNPNPPGLYEVALTVVNDDTNGPLASGVTGLQITFYMVSETTGAFRDDWDAGNGDDRDGAPPAFESPLIYEVDAFFTPQGSTKVENWSLY